MIQREYRVKSYKEISDLIFRVILKLEWNAFKCVIHVTEHLEDGILQYLQAWLRRLIAAIDVIVLKLRKRGLETTGSLVLP